VINFDQALPTMARLVIDLLGALYIDDGLFLRDAQGSLTFILPYEVERSRRTAFEEASRQELGLYAAEPSATPTELFEDDILADPGVVSDPVTIRPGVSVGVRVLDRQIIGQDWARPNFHPASNIPLLTFFSCKEGVGRSTALAVTAAELSSRGKNVIIVNFDLEAPGIGSILLGKQNTPAYGLLVYLIENRIAPISD
jgi:hypothetical protein